MWSQKYLCFPQSCWLPLTRNHQILQRTWWKRLRDIHCFVSIILVLVGVGIAEAFWCLSGGAKCSLWMWLDHLWLYNTAELPLPQASSSHGNRVLVAAGATEQLRRALKRRISSTGLSCLWESAQAINFSFIATFAFDVQIAELNRDKWPRLSKLPWIKASPGKFWS